MDETIQRLRDESAKHQTVYEEDRRRKALFAEAADRLSAAEARVKELEGALDECRAFVACHAVSYSFQHELSKDGQTWHPEHKAFFDRISGLSAAARAEKEDRHAQ